LERRASSVIAVEQVEAFEDAIRLSTLHGDLG
jgi:hypothetical protein